MFLEKRYPHFALVQKQTFFSKCTNNLSNYTTEHQLWIY